MNVVKAYFEELDHSQYKKDDKITKQLKHYENPNLSKTMFFTTDLNATGTITASESDLLRSEPFTYPGDSCSQAMLNCISTSGVY